MWCGLSGSPRPGNASPGGRPAQTAPSLLGSTVSACRSSSAVRTIREPSSTGPGMRPPGRKGTSGKYGPWPARCARRWYGRRSQGPATRPTSRGTPTGMCRSGGWLTGPDHARTPSPLRRSRGSCPAPGRQAGLIERAAAGANGLLRGCFLSCPSPRQRSAWRRVASGPRDPKSYAARHPLRSANRSCDTSAPRPHRMRLDGEPLRDAQPPLSNRRPRRWTSIRRHRTCGDAPTAKGRRIVDREPSVRAEPHVVRPWQVQPTHGTVTPGKEETGVRTASRVGIIPHLGRG